MKQKWAKEVQYSKEQAAQANASSSLHAKATLTLPQMDLVTKQECYTFKY